MDLCQFENLFIEKVKTLDRGEDPAHDFLHFNRVVKVAKQLCHSEGARPEVVVPAAWLHDMIVIAKNDPRRSQASRLSAFAASEFLRQIKYPDFLIKDIAHAIEAHSFSANISAETLEAKIVQDADRLDGLGAIGVARCFATAGLMRRSFYSEQDPFCKERLSDDGQFTVDHFYKKLFKIAETLHTGAGRAEGLKRVEVMKRYLSDLQQETEL